MRVLVLSPHRDDAAFSCGLVLHRLLTSGATVEIVNICTFSNYAPYLATQGGVVDVTGIRRQEDVALAQRLVTTSACRESALTMTDFGWKDAPVRWGIKDDRVLTSGPLPTDEIDDLRKQFQTLAPAEIVLTPLSLGDHVDHRLVHHAALVAFPSNKLVFYEDIPYVCRLTEVEKVIACARGKSLGLIWTAPSPSASGLKKAFGLCYPSQIAAEVAEEMESYAEQLGGRERLFGPLQALQQLEGQLNNSGAA